MTLLERMIDAEGNPMEIRVSKELLTCHIQPPYGPLTMLFRSELSGLVVTNTVASTARLNAAALRRHRNAQASGRLFAVLLAGVAVLAVAAGAYAFSTNHTGLGMFALSCVGAALLVAFLVWPRGTPPDELLPWWAITVGHSREATTLRSYDNEQINRVMNALLVASTVA